MSWTDAYFAIQHDQRKVAWFMAQAWTAAYRSGDAALMSNLAINQWTPIGLAQSLHLAGVPVPGDVAEMDRASAWRIMIPVRTPPVDPGRGAEPSTAQRPEV